MCALRWLIWLLAGLVWQVTTAAAQTQSPVQNGGDLTGASLEELTQMQISVSSFARKEEDLWKTPAAVFVITREQIAGSSLASIPELLRMVPGMQVAQLDASTWAISARGFNSVFAGKLLVLVDGRTVYSEIYSGAHWDQIDLPLEDIERIEVIRGPGAAVWGTNAVNGVVNIITRKARSTLGAKASSSVSRIGSTANVRYGGMLGANAQFRTFASLLDRAQFDLGSGARAFDGENTLRAGGRLDWQKSVSDWVTMSGDTYGGHLRQQVLPDVGLPVGPGGQDRGSIAGGYLLSRWEHSSPRAHTALQVYFDDQSRHELGSRARTRTIDLDFQDHVPVSPRHDIVWGAEYRGTGDHLGGAVIPTTFHDYRNYLVDGFFQDEVSLIPGRVVATLGSKIQNGTLAGFQVQPSARLLWLPSQSQSLWAAVSRAAVSPSIEDKYMKLPLIGLGSENGIAIDGLLQGNPRYKPETLVAYEAGYRKTLGNALSIDLASFVDRNRRLQATLPGTPTLQLTAAPAIVVPFLFVNGFDALSTGIEGTVAWKPVSALSFQGGYAWMQAHMTPTVAGGSANTDQWNAPHSSYSLSSSWNFARSWSADSFVSRVGSLSADGAALGPAGIGSPSAYTRADLRLCHKVNHSVAFEAGGTNLLVPRHLEFGSSTGFNVPDYVPRSLFLKAIWSF